MEDEGWVLSTRRSSKPKFTVKPAKLEDSQLRGLANAHVYNASVES
jgi:hypothetical protein